MKHRINIKCAECGDKWFQDVDDKDFEGGVTEGIYFPYKGYYFAESMCDKCLQQMRAELRQDAEERMGANPLS